ncbi:MAG: hypothetical protein RBQ97_02705 [Acholeplasma sp.]|nr:hypothetical protein [Acholeplasma sp.]
MKFTYKDYSNFINLRKQEGFLFPTFSNFMPSLEKQIIIRHDVDVSIEKALILARIEHDLNISSTFFFLVSTNFYNVLSSDSKSKLSEIASYGHEIGLHFDETQYNIQNEEEFYRHLLFEKVILEKAIGSKVKSFSNHRPSKFVLNGLSDNKIDMFNAYGKTFFVDSKYLSDSRMIWREDIDLALANPDYKNYQIGIHPFWYSDTKESPRQKFNEYFRQNLISIYRNLYDNNSNFSEIISEDQIMDAVSRFMKEDKI